MSKKNKINLEKEIMSQIKTGDIKMKPKWYFMLGSMMMFGGIVALAIVAIFLLNLTIFAAQPHYGPGAEYRLELILNNFPWWAPIIAFVGILLAIWLLKKYDFSYKKNFPLIVLTFVLAVIIGAVIVDLLGFNDYFAKGPMRGFYRQIEKSTDDGSGPRNGRRQHSPRNEQMFDIQNK